MRLLHILIISASFLCSSVKIHLEPIARTKTHYSQWKHDCQALSEYIRSRNTLRRLLVQMLCPELRRLFCALSPAAFLLCNICIHLGNPVYVLSKLHLSFKARLSSWGESTCFLQKHVRLVGVEKPLEFFRLAK